MMASPIVKWTLKELFWTFSSFPSFYQFVPWAISIDVCMFLEDRRPGKDRESQRGKVMKGDHCKPFARHQRSPKAPKRIPPDQGQHRKCRLDY